MFSINGNYVWFDKLNELINFYNNRFHRTIKMKPIDVEKSHENHLLKTVYNYSRHQHQQQHRRSQEEEPAAVRRLKFKINDFVRISKHKGVFEKGYTPNWGTEIFKIVKVNRQQYPEFYYLEDYTGESIKGGFYAYELQKVKHPNGYLIERVLKRKGNKSFCKFLGFSDKHNAWIDSTDTLL